MQFTVFTPTFNRAHSITRVYDCLELQTEKSFEWLIIDDGSTDGTKELVKTLKEKASFPIRYFHQENQGMLLAVKKGVELARGKFFLKADSDDYFKANTLEIFLDTWLTIPENKRGEFAGVTCLVEDEYGDLIGNKFPADKFDSTRAEIVFVHKVKGEKWGFHRTDVMRQFPIPRELGRHYAMGLIIHKIGKQYKTRFVNKTLRVYMQDAGIQVSKRSASSASGRWFTYAIGLNDDIEFFSYSAFDFLKIAVLGSRLAFHHGANLKMQFKFLDSFFAQTVWLVAIPIGYVIYLTDKKQ